VKLTAALGEGQTDGSVSSHPVIALGEDLYNITTEAYADLCGLAGIPTAYAGKIPLDMMIPHLDYLLEKNVGELKAIFDPPKGGVQGNVKAFAKANAILISPSLVLDAFEKGLVVGHGIHEDLIEWQEPIVTLGHVVLSEVAPFTYTPELGDVSENVKGGVYLSFSPICKEAFQLTTYILRLVCSNGMTSPDVTFKWHRHHNADDPAEWLVAASTEAAKAAQKVSGKFFGTRDYIVAGHLADVLASVCDRYHVQSAVRELVMARLLNEGGNTLFDLVNAITYVASNVPEVVEHTKLREKLMMVAGALTEQPEICPSCHRLK